ncbi:hypothetical protein G6F57_021075 [Rhizopus arrhizus]|nr:hypothetical protein G6F57_021075 [Rhizopus arrhizus]
MPNWRSVTMRPGCAAPSTWRRAAPQASTTTNLPRCRRAEGIDPALPDSRRLSQGTPSMKSLLATALSGAALTLLAGTATTAQAAEPFAACLSQLRGPALKAGVSGATFDTHTAGLAPDMAVIDLLDAQPEPAWRAGSPSWTARRRAMA